MHKRKKKERKEMPSSFSCGEKDDGRMYAFPHMRNGVPRFTPFLPLALRLPAYAERRMPEEAGRNRLQNRVDGTRRNGWYEVRRFPMKVAKRKGMKYNRRKGKKSEITTGRRIFIWKLIHRL